MKAPKKNCAGLQNRRRKQTKVRPTIGRFTKNNATSNKNAKALGKEWTQLLVLNLPLCPWSRRFVWARRRDCCHIAFHKSTWPEYNATNQQSARIRAFCWRHKANKRSQSAGKRCEKKFRGKLISPWLENWSACFCSGLETKDLQFGVSCDCQNF